MKDYLGSKSIESALPWDMINTGIDKSFLSHELIRAQSGMITDDCYTGCAVCGMGCSAPRSALRVTYDEERGTRDGLQTEAKPIPDASKHGNWKLTLNAGMSEFQNGIKYTFRYGKYGDARYIGHLDTMNILLRAIRSLGITIRTHGKFHPMPKISLSEALPIGIESTCELIEIEVDTGVLVHQKTITEMNRILPRGIKILEFIKGSIQNMVKDYSYLLIADKSIDMELWKLRYNSKRYFYTWKGKGVKELNLKGNFQRIIKMEDRRIHGLRTDN